MTLPDRKDLPRLTRWEDYSPEVQAEIEAGRAVIRRVTGSTRFKRARARDRYQETAGPAFEARVQEELVRLRASPARVRRLERRVFPLHEPHVRRALVLFRSESS